MIRITYVGHATVQIEAGGTRLLTDPILRSRVAHLRRIVPVPPLQEFRQPDAVLISHAHLDHLDPPSLRLLRSCPVVAPRGCGRVLEHAGLGEVTEAVPGERLRIGATEVAAALLAHDGCPHAKVLASQSWLCLPVWRGRGGRPRLGGKNLGGPRDG